MTIEKMEAVLEGVLFAMGRAVTLRQLSIAIEQDERTTKKLLQNLMDKKEKEGSGVRIVALDGAYQMGTSPEIFEALIRVVKEPKKQVLTNVQVETLAIIAYRQPITRQEIETIRGVKCDHAINKLLEYRHRTSVIIWNNRRIFKMFWSWLYGRIANNSSCKSGKSSTRSRRGSPVNVRSIISLVREEKDRG